MRRTQDNRARFHGTKQWKQLRLEVLEAEPVCHWCKKAKSTEADHIVELARGGEALDRDNLCGSCKPCNLARGQKLRAATQRYNRAATSTAIRRQNTARAAIGSSSSTQTFR